MRSARRGCGWICFQLARNPSCGICSAVRTQAKTLALPIMKSRTAVVVALLPMASLARVTHASLLNILGEDYIRTARAKGLTEPRVMRTHVMRNAIVPILTYTGPLIMEMFTGLLIVENLYGFPGIGREYWVGVLALDYPLIMGMTLIYAAGLMLLNVLIELLCEFIDPRLRSARLRETS